MKDQGQVFTKPEIEFLTDRKLLLSKVHIGKKIEALLGQVEKGLHAVISEYPWPDGVLTRSGKLSKGENYLGLPYYLLDYPRRFDRDNVFAFRTMFWWGNFFSATLHLSGEYLKMSREPLSANIDQIKTSNAFICVNHNPWEYHYHQDNYREVRELTAAQLGKIFSEKSFIKLSFRWEIDRYMDIPSLVPEVFQKMLGWMAESGRR